MAITTSIAIPSLNIQHPSLCSSSSSSSSCKTTSTSITYSEALTIAAAATEAMALANAAVEAAREAMQLSNDVWFDRKRDTRNQTRKRRKGSVQFCEASFEPVFYQYLSSIEGAHLCLCLQDETRLETARRRIGEPQEHEPTMKRLAKALRTRKTNVDKILYRGRQSREKIVSNYRKLVVSIANRYRGKGLSFQELIQEGNIGLLRGAERFDPMRGTKLSTYVYWWIKEAIITSISNKSRIVRQPKSLWEKVAKIEEAKVSLKKRLGRLPSDDEIAEELNMQVSTVRLCFKWSRNPVSLDQAVSDQGRMTLQEIVPGPEELMPENMVKKKLMKTELEELIQTLSEREAHVLKLMFGLNEGQIPQSCDEIGMSMKLCRERVRQISKIALAKLRQEDVIENFKVYLA